MSDVTDGVLQRLLVVVMEG